ncbi:PQQ-binding-like beta-propeller repeat protein [Streptomyces sanglieri]|uniref:PQQ-binding-like beta-propeller repeat protein n=1 Tax=Streptomyces sanglieri TaxID=193460 RepID=A0ABW2WKN3_9ACTN
MLDHNAADRGTTDDADRKSSAKTPALRWRYPIVRAITSSPTVADGVVHIGSGDKNARRPTAVPTRRVRLF